MDSFLNQAKKWWEERNFGQKFTVIFLMVCFVSVLTFLLAKTTQPDWDVLYGEMSPTDAAAVAAHLKDNGILFRVTNEGTTILVPREVKDQTMLDIAEQDLIKEGVPGGLNELENIPISTNQDQQRLWRQKIIQGEISRSIIKIKGVKNARITLAEPERSIFVSEDDLPSASVMLQLNPGVKLKQEQIKAVKNLVAYAVPRLTPDRVFVSDQNGSALSEDMVENSSSLDDLRLSYEKKIEKKVKNVISKLVGNDNVTVAVTAEMNFDKTTAKIERFIPTSQSKDGMAAGVLVSEQLLGEQYTGQDGKAPGGVPGTTSNITNPTYAATTQAEKGKSSDYNKNSTIKNFEVSKETKNITYAPGQVERLTVAVAVNSILTSEQQKNIEKLVSTAAGADMARGDVITITGMSFAGLEDLEKQQAKLQEEAKMDKILSMVQVIGPYALLIIFGGSALVIFWSLIKKPVQAIEVDEYEEPEFEFPDAPEILEAASIPVIEAKLDPEVERMKEELNSFVMNDAAEAARLLLSYIKE